MNGSQFGVPQANALVNPLMGQLSSTTLNDPNHAINRMMYQDVTDPFLTSNIAAANRQIGEDFQRNIIPGLRRGAIANGSWNGTRSDLAQGMAASEIGKRMADMTGQMYSDAYNTQEANRLQAAGMAQNDIQNRMGLSNNFIQDAWNRAQSGQQIGLGSFNNMLNAPLGLLGAVAGVGDSQQQHTQNVLNDAQARWDFLQNANWDNAQRYANLLNGVGGQYNSTSTTGSQEGWQPGIQKNRAAGALGGAASGAAMGASVGGPYGAVIGGVAGGLMGGLS